MDVDELLKMVRQWDTASPEEDAALPPPPETSSPAQAIVQEAQPQDEGVPSTADNETLAVDASPSVDDVAVNSPHPASYPDDTRQSDIGSDHTSQDTQLDSVAAYQGQGEASLDISGLMGEPGAADSLLDYPSGYTSNHDQPLEVQSYQQEAEAPYDPWEGDVPQDNGVLSLPTSPRIKEAELRIEESAYRQQTHATGGGEYPSQGVNFGPSFLNDLGNVISPQMGELKHQILANLQDSIDREALVVDAMGLG